MSTQAEYIVGIVANKRLFYYGETPIDSYRVRSTIFPSVYEWDGRVSCSYARTCPTLQQACQLLDQVKPLLKTKDPEGICKIFAYDCCLNAILCCCKEVA